MFRLLSCANWTGRLRTDTTKSPPDHFKIIDYALSSSLQSVRLSVSYQHKIIHLLASRTSESDIAPIPFETILFDSVEPTFGRSLPSWRRRHPEDMEHSPEVYKLEEELYHKSKELLPPLISNFDPGAQIFAKLATDTKTGEIRIKLLGDLFVDIMANDLPVLSPHDCAGVPRITLTAIDSYIACWNNNVWLVDIVLPSSRTSIRAVLKTVRVPESGQISDDDAEWTATALREVKTLSSLPSHPNVIPASLALVTLKPPQGTQRTLDAHSKLIGMVVPYYSGGPYRDVGQKTDDDLKRRLRHGYEFASAVQHTNRNGVYLGDLGLHNIALTAPPPNDHIVLIDFELVPMYVNLNGPDAPEASGHWEVSIHDGRSIYKHCETPINKSKTIREEWAANSDALERLEVFGVGCSLAAMVQCPVYFPWLDSFTSMSFNLHGKGPETPRPYANTTWEAKVPQKFCDLVQRCCSYDPRDRPLLDEVVATLEQWA
ncbi:hypothetical protein A4X13_0g6854 [Tilletia indica]|uniref:Protein kinase domain-containing protein n=1 Tax=Tilletia indica TaxID=43049 RepID=A0A8T8SN25_9BASI|nr:hypothetical protein A4X13_0g6854 [Tilletia indica]